MTTLSVQKYRHRPRNRQPGGAVSANDPKRSVGKGEKINVWKTRKPGSFAG
jgi:hypothetical protein